MKSMMMMNDERTRRTKQAEREHRIQIMEESLARTTRMDREEYEMLQKSFRCGGRKKKRH